MKSLSLIIPAYNEEQRLPVFLETVKTYIDTHPGDIQQLIIVDDGSSDATVSTANKFASRISQMTVLSHQTNKGKGAAIQTGVAHGSCDLIVFMDADGATPISELPKMRQALEKAQVAVGNRWMAGAQVHRSSPFRHISGWVYKTYMSMFGLNGIDTMCGFKGYEAAVAKDLFSNLLEPRWLFDTEVAYKAVKRGYTIKNFPIEWASVEGSKLSSGDLLKSALSIWPLIQRIKKEKI
ncbi:MAG: dolichyl-phosphate beta-glucosyltransferase [Candidatus Andersenbacteria bacterium]